MPINFFQGITERFPLNEYFGFYERSFVFLFLNFVLQFFFAFNMNRYQCLSHFGTFGF